MSWGAGLFRFDRVDQSIDDEQRVARVGPHVPSAPLLNPHALVVFRSTAPSGYPDRARGLASSTPSG